METDEWTGKRTDNLPHFALHVLRCKKLSCDIHTYLYSYEYLLRARCWCVLRRLPSVNLSGVDADGISALQQQLREKELRLTDVQLEALSSAHRLHQMQDAIRQLKASLHVH